MKMFRIMPLLLAASALAVAGGQQGPSTPQPCCIEYMNFSAFVGTEDGPVVVTPLVVPELVNGCVNGDIIFTINPEYDTLRIATPGVALYGGANTPVVPAEIDVACNRYSTIGVQTCMATLSFPVSSTTGTLLPAVWSPTNFQDLGGAGLVKVFLGGTFDLGAGTMGPGSGTENVLVYQM